MPAAARRRPAAPKGEVSPVARDRDESPSHERRRNRWTSQPLRRRAPARHSVRPLPRPTARPPPRRARHGARGLRAGPDHGPAYSRAWLRRHARGLPHLRRPDHPPPGLNADPDRRADAPCRGCGTAARPSLEPQAEPSADPSCTEDWCSLCLDFERFVGQLPLRLRRCCNWLLAENRLAAAAALGLHRSSLYEAAHDLKRKAIEAGLHLYLQAGPTPTPPIPAR